MIHGAKHSVQNNNKKPSDFLSHPEVGYEVAHQTEPNLASNFILA
jgi:hypothetical protein